MSKETTPDLHETQAAIAGLTQYGIDREQEARAVEHSEVDRIKAALAPAVKEAREAVALLTGLDETHGPAIRQLGEINWDVLQRTHSQTMIGQRIHWLKRSLDAVQGWLQLAGQYRRAVERIDHLNAREVKFGEHIPLEAQIKGAMTTVTTLEKEIPQLFKAVREVEEALAAAPVPLPEAVRTFIRLAGEGNEQVRVIRET